VSFEPFAALAGLGLFTTAYLAGITSVSGGILAGVIASGGIVFIATDEWLSTGGWYEVISAVGLILTVILNPEGIVGPAHDLAARLRGGPRGRVDTGSLAATVVERPERAPVDESQLDQSLLSIRDISVRYGGVVAVSGVSFDVPEGRIVGLIGPNGAGKTTLMDAISGFAPSTGRVSLGDQSLETLSAHGRVRAGLGRTFQAIELYDDLSVSENVVVGLSAHGGGVALRGARERLDETLDLLGLGNVRHRPAKELSQGQRQLVSIARALSGGPRLLLLDEPAGGLDTTESHWLGDRLRDIRDTGITILLVDHDMSLVLSLCDEIQVLNFGEVIAAGSPAQIRADRGVAAAYLGSTHAEGIDA
jgi:ABC-type branched-subunit amino acid transport system ATPase component